MFIYIKKSLCLHKYTKTEFNQSTIIFQNQDEVSYRNGYQRGLPAKL